MARIVIVDDNLLIRTLLREILSRDGHTVVGEARDGAEALDWVPRLSPDLVTLNLVMPGPSGLVTLDQLMKIDPRLTVVICSAVRNARTVMAALQIGAKGFIAKPFTSATVLDNVRRSLEESDLAASPPPRPPVADPPDIMPIERREFRRAPETLQVTVTVDDGDVSSDTRTIDLGGGGMLLADGSLPLGAAVGFSLYLEPHGPPISGRARVTRVTHDGQPALAFEQLSIADHERLISYLNHAGRRTMPADRTDPRTGRPRFEASAEPAWLRPHV